MSYLFNVCPPIPGTSPLLSRVPGRVYSDDGSLDRAGAVLRAVLAGHDAAHTVARRVHDTAAQGREVHTFLAIRNTLSHGGMQKIQNATYYDLYILLSPRPHSYISRSIT